MAEHMAVRDLLREYGPGDSGDQDDPWSWADEFAQLWGLTPQYMAELVNAIRHDGGIQEPLLLGHDGRLWDGHHRLAVAVALMHDSVPVVHAVPRADGRCCEFCYAKKEAS